MVGIMGLVHSMLLQKLHQKADGIAKLLLSNPPDAITVSMRNPLGDERKKVSATKWLLGQKFPCTGKKSMQVEDKLSEPTIASD